MKIISVIEQPEVIKAIFQHIGLWERQKRPPPKIKATSADYCAVDHIPVYDSVDPDYPFEAYI